MWLQNCFEYQVTLKANRKLCLSLNKMLLGLQANNEKPSQTNFTKVL